MLVDWSISTLKLPTGVVMRAVVGGKFEITALNGVLCPNLYILCRANGHEVWMADLTHASKRFFLTQGLRFSKKFADMMESTIKDYASKHNLALESIVKIPLEGEGSIEARVDKSVSCAAFPIAIHRPRCAID